MDEIFQTLSQIGEGLENEQTEKRKVGMQLTQPSTICCGEGERSILKRLGISIDGYLWIVVNH